MEQIKRTPGTWHAERWSCHAATTVLVHDDLALTGKAIVAEFETEEDARLASAAPEMAEALQIALDTIPAKAIKSSTRIVMEVALEKATGVSLAPREAS